MLHKLEMEHRDKELLVRCIAHQFEHKVKAQRNAKGGSKEHQRARIGRCQEEINDIGWSERPLTPTRVIEHREALIMVTFIVSMRCIM